jgi:uncharacterized coiled-coil protein SlyX
MELAGIEPKKELFDAWSKSLRWVYSPRLARTWEEFSGDQLRMQGVEAMQRQLMVREKRRAADRLECRAAEFEDKKRAIQELNQAVAERRAELIEEQKALKKRFEPDAYERILREDPLATPVKEIYETDD